METVLVTVRGVTRPCSLPSAVSEEEEIFAGNFKILPGY